MTLHNWAIFGKNALGAEQQELLMTAPGQALQEVHPSRAHKEQKVQVHLWTLHQLVHFKKLSGNNP